MLRTVYHMLPRSDRWMRFLNISRYLFLSLSVYNQDNHPSHLFASGPSLLPRRLHPFHRHSHTFNIHTIIRSHSHINMRNTNLFFFHLPFVCLIIYYCTGLCVVVHKVYLVILAFLSFPLLLLLIPFFISFVSFAYETYEFPFPNSCIKEGLGHKHA